MAGEEDEFDPNWSPLGATPPKEQETPPEDPLAALKAQLEAEQKAHASAEQARVAAEQRANASAHEAFKAKTDAGDSQLQMVIGAIEQIKSNRMQLKAAKAAAMRDQDFDAAAEIDEQIADNAARLLQLENGKASMEAAPKPQLQLDPVEAFARQLTPRSAAWVRQHPEYVRDPLLFKQMSGAHDIVTGKGVAVDTDAYFTRIEDILFDRKPAKPATEEDEDPMQEAAQRTPPPSAPVGRAPPNRRSARLTEAEREIAALNHQTEEEYAKNKAALTAEGRMGRMH